MIVRIDGMCGNIDCPNRPESGPFMLVTIGEGNVVGGHRAFRLFLCAPCANGLDKVIGNKARAEAGK